MQEGVTDEALVYALTRMQDFAAVQQGRELAEQLESIRIVQDSLGFTEEHQEMLSTWMRENVGELSGEVLLGLLIGLHIMHYHFDRPA